MMRLSGTHRVCLLALSSIVLVLAFASSAAAVDEPLTTAHNCTCHWENAADCTRCHQYPVDGQDAGSDGIWSFFAPYNAYMNVGPHGLYTTTTSRCDMCHTLHDAPTGFKLLPGATVRDTCFSCHDGTGGQGVYGAITARGGAADPPGHDVDETNVVPGGDPASGGSATVAFRGVGGNMTCSDCHSPHGSNTVAKFTGERIRIWTNMETPSAYYSTKLLKQRPTGATVSVAEYGSDWCMACHKGRASGGMVMNHPVESTVTNAAPYVYGRVPLNRTWNQVSYWAGLPTLTNEVVIGTLGFISSGNWPHNPSNIPGDPGPDPYASVSWMSSGWLMKYPRAAQQAGHGPICQQCHEDSREAGYITDDGSQAWLMPDYADGPTADGREVAGKTANPRFQNFPHETENANLLLETGDDLCLNCHPTGQLP